MRLVIGKKSSCLFFRNRNIKAKLANFLTFSTIFVSDTIHSRIIALHLTGTKFVVILSSGHAALKEVLSACQSVRPQFVCEQESKSGRSSVLDAFE